MKTANGMTKEAAAGSCLGQGSAGGALNSQLNLHGGIQAYSEGSCEEYYKEAVTCQCVIFNRPGVAGAVL